MQCEYKRKYWKNIIKNKKVKNKQIEMLLPFIIKNLDLLPLIKSERGEEFFNKIREKIFGTSSEPTQKPSCDQP